MSRPIVIRLRNGASAYIFNTSRREIRRTIARARALGEQTVRFNNRDLRVEDIVAVEPGSESREAA